jgi:SIR2-like domain
VRSSLKIHERRCPREQSSFVISEDDYIDSLTRTDISNVPPVKLAEKLRNSNFLFFGYSLRDWTLRVILHRIWSDQQLNYTSWAVQLNHQDLDERFWRRRDVEIIDADLEHYTKALSQRVQTLPMQKRAEVRE